MTLELVPIRRDEAKEYILAHHRHNAPPLQWVFSVGVLVDGVIVGVGLAGRPAARALDDGRTLEITRICSAGVPNVCSRLYGALTRAAFALGYKRVVTYTLQSEPGASLKAAGFEPGALLAERGGWDCAARPRKEDPSPRAAKIRWEKKA